MVVNKPNLFIVGAAKAGTSSLWYILKQHEKIFMPEDELVKEPCYFSDLTGMKEEEKYLKLFQRASNQKYIGEASTAYLTDPVSAKRIYEFNPEAKIIIMLRNPILRAYSLYNWMVQDGYEYANNFEAALLKEEKRKNKIIPNNLETQYFYNYMYFSSGLYWEQIMRYCNFFPQENVFIGIFEYFLQNPEAFIEKLLIFLDLNLPDSMVYEHKNPSRQALHPYLSFSTRKFITYLERIRAKLKKHGLPISATAATKDKRDFLLKLTSFDTKPKPIKAKTYKNLQNKYELEYSRLEKDFKLNLNIWRKRDDLFLQKTNYNNL